MDENLWDQILTDQIVTGRETVCIAGPAMRLFFSGYYKK